MNPFFLGGITGAALALLNFLASAFFSTKVISQAKMTSVALALIGFVVRLTLVGIIFYALTKIKWIHFHTALITFAAFFTLCTVWKATRVYREAKPLMKQQTEM